MAKLSNVLLTKVDASTANGLPGFMLTVADAAASGNLSPVQLALHGPPRIQARADHPALRLSSPGLPAAFGGLSARSHSPALRGAAQGLMTAVETIVRDRHVAVTPKPFGAPSASSAHGPATPSLLPAPAPSAPPAGV